MTQPVDLGTCWSTPNGQNLSMPSTMATGLQCVAEAILRRWSTGAGQLIDDPTYGYNLTDLINAELSTADIFYAQQQAAAQAQLDERVLSCTCTITLPASGTLTVNAVVVTSAGPFTLVATISSVSTSLLLVSP